MAKTNTIITIGRQFGSGGREIGYMVADKLGIKLYDKEIREQRGTAVSAKNCLNLMMKNRVTVFFIPW